MLENFKRLSPHLWNVECDMEHSRTYWQLEESDRAMFLMRKCINTVESEILKAGRHFYPA